MYTWTKNHDGEIVEWISSGNGAVWLQPLRVSALSMYVCVCVEVYMSVLYELFSHMDYVKHFDMLARKRTECSSHYIDNSEQFYITAQHRIQQ